MSRPVVQTGEWQALQLPAALDNPMTRQRILRAGDTALGEAFRLRKGKVYARDLVGLVDVGQLQVQVVPKLYDGQSQADEAALLLDLIAQAALPMRAAVLPNTAKLSLQPISEPICRHVAGEMHRLLLQGVPRRYRAISELSPTIRGRVDLGQLARRHPGQQHVVPIRYAPLQQDNALTRVLRALVDELTGLSRNAKTKAALIRCSHVLHQAARIPLTTASVDAVELSRLDQHWEPMIELARVMAQRSSHDLARAGRHSGFGLLFPLDGIFEALLSRTLRRSLVGSNFSLQHGKAAGRLLRGRTTGVETFAIKPDLIVREVAGSSIVIVGDAKWKRLELSKPGLGISQSDVYQVLSYMQRLGVSKSMLFYPQHVRDSDWVQVHDYDVLPAVGRLTVVQVKMEALLSRDAGERAAADAALQSLIESQVEG